VIPPLQMTPPFAINMCECDAVASLLPSNVVAIIVALPSHYPLRSACAERFMGCLQLRTSLKNRDARVRALNERELAPYFVAVRFDQTSASRSFPALCRYYHRMIHSFIVFAPISDIG
jgi:hypothetical protein